MIGIFVSRGDFIWGAWVRAPRPVPWGDFIWGDFIWGAWVRAPRPMPWGDFIWGALPSVSVIARLGSEMKNAVRPTFPEDFVL